MQVKPDTEPITNMKNIKRRDDILHQISMIPLGAEQFLVYAPLKKIAFVANGVLVNKIYDYCLSLNSKSSQKLARNKAKELAFLGKVNFFQPEPLPADEYLVHGIRYDSVILFPTNRCNLRCKYCYANSGEYPIEEMPWEIAKTSIDFVMEETIKNKAPEFTLAFHGGGEPTLNWKLVTRAVEYTRSLAKTHHKKLNISGSFNGCWPEPVQNYILNNFTDISISFDGMPDTQNKQRPSASQGNSFAKVAKTLRLLDNAKFKYGIRMTVTEKSVHAVDENIGYICSRYKPQQVQIEPVFEEGRAKSGNLSISKTAVFVEQFAKAHNIAHNYGIPILYSGVRIDMLLQRFCLAACRALVVTPTGDITSCFEIFSKDHTLSEEFFVGKVENGNVNVDPNKLNKHFSRTVENMSYCEGCFCKWHCAGDCAAKRNVTYGDEESGSARFLVNREIAKFLILDKIHKSGGITWLGKEMRWKGDMC